MNVSQMRPIVGSHPLGPGPVVPELGVLVDVALNAGRAGFIIDDLAVAEAHGVVNWVRAANDALHSAGAFAPVLTVIFRPERSAP